MKAMCIKFQNLLVLGWYAKSFSHDLWVLLAILMLKVGFQSKTPSFHKIFKSPGFNFFQIKMRPKSKEGLAFDLLLFLPLIGFKFSHFYSYFYLLLLLCISIGREVVYSQVWDWSPGLSTQLPSVLISSCSLKRLKVSQSWNDAPKKSF